jgi:hypothetical protein
MSKENFIRCSLFYNVLPTKRHNDDRRKIRINNSKQTVFNKRSSNTISFRFMLSITAKIRIRIYGSKVLPTVN